MIVDDTSQLEACRRAIRKVVRVDARLPQSVFEPQFSSFSWFEFEDSLVDGFAHLLRNCARLAGDRWVCVECLDPDARSAFGHSGVCRIETSRFDVAEYHQYLDYTTDRDHPGCAVRTVGMVLAF